MTLALLLAACSGDALDTGPACAEGEHLSGGACVPEACGRGRWGDAVGDVWVDGSAAPGGDGDQEAPFATIGEALALGQPLTIAVASGTYPESLRLESGQDDVTVVGRCADLVTVDASGLDDETGLLALGRSSKSWTVVGLTVLGGFPGVYLVGGRLTLREVVITESRIAGVLVVEVDSDLVLEDVVVRDVREEDVPPVGVVGYGIDVEEGADLVATGLRIENAYRIGLLATGTGSELDLTDVEISGTRPTDGGVGVGLSLADEASVRATGLVVADCAGAGVLVSGEAQADLGDAWIRDTRATHEDTQGIQASYGGQLSLAGARITGTEGVGLGLLDEGTHATLNEVEISGATDPGKGDRAGGIHVQWQASAELDGCSVADNEGRGLQIAGGTLVARNTEIRDNRGIGLQGGLEGGAVTLVDVTITGTRADEDAGGGGLEITQGGVLEATRVRVEDNQGVGVLLSSGAHGTLEDVTVAHTHSDGLGLHGRGLTVQEGATATVLGGLLEGNREAGLFASSDAVVDLEGLEIRDTFRSGYYAAAAGLNVQDGAVVVARELSVTGTEGPGIFALSGSASCTDCTLTGNGFAGAVVHSGELTLDGGTVQGNPPDDSLGGGVGILSAAPYEAPLLSLDGVTISEHAYGSLYLDGPGTYTISGADLEGGTGWELVAGRTVHGDALFATGGVAEWNEDAGTGLRLEGTTLRDSVGAGLFLDASSATLSRTTFAGNATDLVQQACGEGLATPIGTDEATTTTMCPATSRLVVPLEMEMHLEDDEALAY